jgi:hypothetical protein
MIRGLFRLVYCQIYIRYTSIYCISQLIYECLLKSATWLQFYNEVKKPAGSQNRP